MSNAIIPIDATTLAAVTGGTSHSSDPLKDLSSLASSIKDLSKQTSGFSSTQMLLLCVLALQRNQQPAGVVYVGRSRWY